jgi:hypothetical protein
MSRNTQNEEVGFYVSYWRDQFRELCAKLENISIVKALVDGDSYYDSVDGFNDYRNIVSRRASIHKTRRAVKSLEKYLERQENSKLKKIIKRQGLKIPKT